MTFEQFISSLPQLTGSEKQVSWALKERQEALGKIWRDAEARREVLADPSKSERVRERHQAALDRDEHLLTVLSAQTEASFWINNRSNNTWERF
jgi:hypothetical protein